MSGIKEQFWGLDIGNAEINSTVIYNIIFHILIVILFNARGPGIS